MEFQEKNRRILIVDDSASVHDDIRAILSCGPTTDKPSESERSWLGDEVSTTAVIAYEIDSAHQGQDGLDRVIKAVQKGRPYALAIVACRMLPGWDGVETIERMRDVDPHLQIAICSSDCDLTWHAIHDKFGTNDWLLILRKPFDLAEIQQLACAMTEKWNYARQASWKMEQLENMVEDHAQQLRHANAELAERNALLAETNDQLSKEMYARQLADEQIRHIAFHDSLTDLPNRALLMERLNTCIDRSKLESDYRFAVLFTDVDDFKVVNDSLGHRVGDELLSQIAAELVRSVRKVDVATRPCLDTVARLGGDEFVILLDDVKEVENVVRIAKRIQRAVSKPLCVGHREVVPSLSVGVAVCRNDYEDAVDIIRDADTALYEAKDQGKSRVSFFDQAMRSRVLERVDMENDLTLAIEERQFVVYYQPIVSLVTGSVSCMEALVRWQHPKRGLLPPDAFLPVAEHTGLVEDIGAQVLQEVAYQLLEWRAAFPHRPELSVSLNLSACQLLSDRLVREIDDCVEKYGLETSSIKLELTESMMMHNLKEAEKVIDDVMSREIEIYLDDFGTGYSSLSVLHTLPFAAIKLDRSFVSNLDTDAECETAIRAMVMMAKNRNLRLIAEGVQTYQQIEVLRDLECEFGQGYFFSRPVPAHALHELLESGACYCVANCESDECGKPGAYCPVWNAQLAAPDSAST